MAYVNKSDHLYFLVTFLLGTTLVATSCTVDYEVCDRDKLLVITYGEGNSTKCGDKILKSVTSARPHIALPGGQEGEKYLLLMVDPDAPSGCFVHDIETTTITNGELKTDKETVKYKQPSPPPGEEHRYQFFLYSWPNTNPDIVYDKKKHFHLSKFVDGVSDLGDSVAVFQFRVQAP